MVCCLFLNVDVRTFRGFSAGSGWWGPVCSSVFFPPSLPGFLAGPAVPPFPHPCMIDTGRWRGIGLMMLDDRSSCTGWFPTNARGHKHHSYQITSAGHFTVNRNYFQDFNCLLALLCEYLSTALIDHKILHSLVFLYVI